MLVVFGSINLDLVARVPRIPAPGETLAGSGFVTAPGGKGANQALAARRAGASVALFGAVGQDSFATQALTGLAAAGVDLTGVASVAAPTGVALVHVADSGENAIIVVAGANALARAAQLRDDDLVENGTLLMQLEVPIAEVSRLAMRASVRRMRCVLNAAPVATLPPSLLESLDILIVNEHEAAALATAADLPQQPEPMLRELLACFGLLTVVTLGSRGALAIIDGNVMRAVPPAVTVHDTTGAGDAFAGALCAALDRGEGIAAALADGVASGALACEALGAQSALPDAGRIRDAAKKVEWSNTS